MAKFDKPLWLADGRPPTRRGTTQAVVAALAFAITVGRWLMVGSLGRTALAVMFVASIGFIIWYCIWRRRRNRVLTGSPTIWPEEDL